MTNNQVIPHTPRLKATGGRQATEFCEITANLLANWLAAGHFECEFYELPEVPPWVTERIIDRWKVERETFVTRLARARAKGAENLIKQAQDGLKSATGRDEIYRARELAGLFKWRAARLNPKDFGDTLDVNVAGTVEIKAVEHVPEWLKQAVKARKEAIDITPEEPEQPGE